MNALLGGLLSRPRTIVTLLMFLLCAGVVVYTTIPKEANPDIDVPIFYVSVTQQGISPEDAQRLLVKPMETALRGLDGLKEINAVASEGHAGIILEFHADFNKDEALADVRDKVDQAKAELPNDADEPTITETNFSLVPTIIVALSGDVPERTLFRYARVLEDAIEALPTVLSANLEGAREEQLEVLIDKTRMESYGLEPLELLNSLSRNNALVPAGFIDTGEGRFSVKVPGLIENADDVFSMVLKQNADGVVTVRDIAEVRRSFKDPTTFTRVNGAPAITINVVKRIGENIIENNEAVRSVVADATSEWPSSVKVDFLLDQSSFIFEVLGGLESSIATAVVLVMIVVVAALGFRSALLVGIAIPTSILLGFLTLSGLGMTVNMMVMFGLVLTVGLLVDGAIIVVEYADQKMAQGYSRFEAFTASAKVMAWPLIASTLTTLIAFMPMLLWPGVPGEFMSYLPIMVIIVLSVALVTALVFLPVLGALLSNALIVGLFAGIISAALAVIALSGMGTGAYVAAGLAFILATVLATRLAGRWERKAVPRTAEDTPFDPSTLRGAGGLYVRSLRLLAGNVVGIVLTLVVVVGGAFGIMTVFMANNAGVEFFVDEEPDVAVVMISGRGNMSAREALDLVLEVEQEVLGIDGVDNVVAIAFPSGGNSASGRGMSDGGDKPSDLIGQLQVELVDYCCRRRATAIFDDIRERTNFAGIKVEVRKIEGGPPTGKDIQLQITSSDYSKVIPAVERIRAHMETVAGLRDFEDDRPLPGIEWQLNVDREEAGRFGADIATVGQMIQLVTNGVLLTEYQPDDAVDRIDVRVRYPEADRTLEQFGNLRLQTPQGLVPLANFVEITPQQRVSSINRVNGLYAMTVKADVLDQEGYDLNAKIAELDAWVKAEEWPAGLFFQFRGANEEQAESMSFLMKAMAASLVLMFLVLVTQFNSFYQTGLTLFTIVLSVFGVLLGMAITGQKFSVIMTGTGIIALAGIVVNNAIVLIDTFNREKLQQPDVLTAVLATAAQRVRPVLLTTITTIAGLIPMATQVNLNFFTATTAVGGITSIWWVQLSTAIIFGLGFSTLLTLVVVPVMLAMPETVSRTVARLRGREVAAVPAAAVATPALALPSAADWAGARLPEVREPVRSAPTSPPAPSRVDGGAGSPLLGRAEDPAAPQRRGPLTPVTAREARAEATTSAAAARLAQGGDLDVYAPVLAPAARREAGGEALPAPTVSAHPEAAE